MTDEKRAARTATETCQDDLARALAGAERTNALLDRQVFRLRTLYEVTSELAGLDDSRAICEAFLLLVMGPLGLVSGFVLHTDRDAHPDEVDMTQRGLEEAESRRLRDGVATLFDKLFHPGSDRAQRPILLSGAHLGRGSELPPSIRTLAAVPIGRADHLLVGFGPNLAGEEPGPDELDLIQSLVVNLRTSLATARAAETVARLNADLARKNESLNRSLDRVLAAQAELDRRAFQLRSLYEVASDLSGLTLPGDVADVFLLDLLGVVSAADGYLAVCGADPGATLAAARGANADAAVAALVAPEAREAVLAAHVSLKDRLPHAMQAVLVTEPGPLSHLPRPAEAALFFAVDRDCRGVVGLGPRLAGGPYGDDASFLGSLATSFLSALARARQYETITRLNRELTERNAELTRTIADLTSARQEIDLLTAAKERILSLVRGELLQAGKVRLVDFVLILAFGTALGLLYNLASPSGIPLVPPALLAPAPAAVSAPEAATLLAGGGLIIDARPAEFHQAERIPGSINMPSAIFDFVYGMHLSTRDPELPVIVYGRTVSSRHDLEAAQKLERLGHVSVRVLEDGLDGWRAAGMPVETGP